jgi:hypothetical protein
MSMMDIEKDQPSNIIRITEDLVKLFNDGRSKPRNKVLAKQIFDNQVEYEAYYTENARLCHTNGKGSILGINIADLSGIHKDIIINKLKTNFYDVTFMNEFRCMINTIIDISDGDVESERARIHHFINDPKRFGEQSVFNFALRSDIRAVDNSGKSYDTFTGDMIVVKCPREPLNAKELIHELVVGVELSKLREYGCCGFSEVYDAWYCGAPVVNDKTNEVLNWCMNSEKPVSYVMYENIQNAKPIKDLVKDNSLECGPTTLKYLTQISLYLYLAEKFCGFSHQDAHDDNILLRKYSDKEFFIYCYFEDKDYYVPSPGSIATFIDYGMSRVILPDGTNVGKLDVTGSFANIDISSTDGTAIADIHKLLCFLLLRSILDKNEQLFYCISRLLGGYFYGTQNMTLDEANYLTLTQNPFRYHLPPDYVREKGWSIIGFIKYLYEYSKQVYGLIVMHESVPEGSLIFGNIDFPMSDPETTKEIIGLDIAEIPSLFDLEQSPDNIEIKERVMKHISTIVHNERLEISSILNSADPAAFIPLESTGEGILNEIEYANHAIESVAVVSNNCYLLLDKLKVYRCTNHIISAPILNELVLECQSKYSSNSVYIETIKNVLFENYRRLKIVIDEHVNSLQKLNSQNPKDNNLIASETKKYEVLFNLFDKYEKVISTLKKLGVTL